MIARRLRMNTESKSNFIRLTQYLLNTQGHNQRVMLSSATNCVSGTEGREDVEWAAIEIEATQRQNVRARGDKTYHMVLSFRDEPAPEIIRNIEKEICAELGFKDHQRISVLHCDSDNVHLHIAINKIHPTKLTIHEPYYDHIKLAKACVRLEHEYLVAKDNHEFRTSARPTAAQNMEAAGDMESLVGWIQRECGKQLKEASSWHELHDILGEHHLKLKPRGAGFIISSGKYNVKASSVDRSLSKGQLEKRLGAFVACEQERASRKKYEPRPMQHGHPTSNLWNRYLEARKENDLRRSAHLAELKEEHQSILASLGNDDFQNAVTRYFVKGSFWKRTLYSLQRAERRRKVADLRKSMAVKRAAIYQQTKRLSWRDWLNQEAKNGNMEALAAIQARGVKHGRNQVELIEQKNAGFPVKVTHHGTRIFSDGCRDLNGSVQLPYRPNDTQIRSVLNRASSSSGVRVSGTSAFVQRLLNMARSMNLRPRWLQKEIAEQWQQILRQPSAKSEIQSHKDRSRR